MLVEVVQLRVAGMKLTQDELAAATRHSGNLTFSTDATASLHIGENSAINHVLAPMVGARLVKMVGDEFLISGSQYAAYGKTTQMHPQSWWCRNLRGDHLKETQLMKAYGAPPPLLSVAAQDGIASV